MSQSVQELCEHGQQHLMATRYWQAEQSLLQAETSCLASGDFDTLARLYMPLQEARRQRRIICGEGIVRLDLICRSAHEKLDADAIIARHPQGQLLIAGWGSIAPALQVRELGRQRQAFVETLLAAAYPIAGGSLAIVIVPNDEVCLPAPDPMLLDHLLPRLPPHSIVLPASELPAGAVPGDASTFARVCDWWERLHRPFLASADQSVDPLRRIAAYRRTIEVDYACELAHQKLSAVAMRQR